MTAAIVCVYLYLIVSNRFQKPRKDVQEEHYCVTPLSLNVFYLENPSEHLPETTVPAEDLRR